MVLLIECFLSRLPYTVKRETIKNVDASHTTTIATTSSQTIDGSTTLNLPAQYEAVTVQSDGANWQVISQPFALVKSGLAKTSGGTLEWGVPTNSRFSQVGTTTLNINQVRYSFMRIDYPVTLTAWQLEVTTGPASNANIAVGVYAADKNLQPIGAPLYDSGSVAVASAFTGIKTATGLSIVLMPGMYLVALNIDVAMTLRGLQEGASTIDAGMGANPFVQKVIATQTFGAYPNPGTAWTATNTGSGGLQHSAVWQWTE